MKKRFSLLIVLLSFVSIFSAQATHIVGGELTLVHQTGNQYIVGLNMYFDAINGQPGAIDQTVSISVFSQATNQLVETFQLPIVSDEFVPYTDPECAVGSLVTRQIIYAISVELDVNKYKEGGGYYMSWERCCRNDVIDNIVNPQSSGQAFYLEFPALTDQSSPTFENSSPTIFPPVGDYACVNQPFVFDFSGVDPDGDQLRYVLRTPLNGNSSPNDVVPVGVPRPYQDVIFTNGINLANMIPGSPPLSITTDGVLSMTPSRTGLFVFAVGVEEYRNGIKIGEVRREFQIQVLDCPPATPPKVELFADQITGSYQEGQVLSYEVNDDKCEILEIRDTDPSTQTSVRIIPINFSGGGSISPSTGIINGANDVFRTEICFPECPNPNGDNYLMDVIVQDNSCPIPLYDTLRVEVEIILPPNDPPSVTTDANFNQDEGCYEARVVIGEDFSLNVLTDDVNQDTVSITAFGNGFDLADLGMSFEDQTGLPVLTSAFNWNPQCEDIDDLLNGADSAEFQIFFVGNDKRKCDQISAFDTTCINLVLVAPSDTNSAPILTTDLLLDGNTNVYVDTLRVGDAFTFNLLGNDLDEDSLTLTMFGNGFDPATLGVELNPLEGFSPLTSQFSWTPKCEDLQNPADTSFFLFDFIVKDYDACEKEEKDADTVQVKLVLLPVINEAPTISTDDLIFNLNEAVYCDTLSLSDMVSFTLLGDDPEKDTIDITAIGVGFDLEELGMDFTTVTGVAPQTAEFEWLMTCQNVNDFNFDEPYFVDFIVTDRSECDVVKQDTLRVKFIVLPDTTTNTKPELSTTLEFDTNTDVYCDTILVDEDYSFDVLLEDLELDSVKLEALGVDFDLTTLQMEFDEVTGNAPQESTFNWKPLCEMLGEGGADKTYFIDFVATELRNDCLDVLGDTIRVKLVITRGNNVPPTAETDLDFDANQVLYTAELNVNEELSFKALGDDLGGDFIFLDVIGEDFELQDLGISFTAVSGIAPLESTVTWTPTCQFLDGATEKEVFLKVLVSDLADCSESSSTTARVKITVKDTQRIGEFTPINVFTPNADGKNDTFHISNLPANTCTDAFLGITIFNRWGKEVFQSDLRDFAWDGGDFPSGVYFYTLKFESEEFKGSVSLIRSK
jgi:gliding motility-associated-like protein